MTKFALSSVERPSPAVKGAKAAIDISSARVRIPAANLVAAKRPRPPLPPLPQQQQQQQQDDEYDQQQQQQREEEQEQDEDIAEEDLQIFQDDYAMAAALATSAAAAAAAAAATKPRVKSAHHKIVADEHSTNPALSAEAWSSLDDLFWDHMREVENKWDMLKLNDDIWAKLIYFEHNRRLAKAYVSTPVLAIDGSTSGLDGFRVGLSGIENPYRDLDSMACLRSIGLGVKLKIDAHGNILVRKMADEAAAVFVQDWPDAVSSSSSSSRELQHADVSYKLFDMRKFRARLDSERGSNSSRSIDWRKCVTIISFVHQHQQRRPVATQLDDPCWLMLINIIAIDMLKRVAHGPDSLVDEHALLSASSSPPPADWTNRMQPPLPPLPATAATQLSRRERYLSIQQQRASNSTWQQIHELRARRDSSLTRAHQDKPLVGGGQLARLRPSASVSMLNAAATAGSDAKRVRASANASRATSYSSNYVGYYAPGYNSGSSSGHSASQQQQQLRYQRRYRSTQNLTTTQNNNNNAIYTTFTGGHAPSWAAWQQRRAWRHKQQQGGALKPLSMDNWSSTASDYNSVGGAPHSVAAAAAPKRGSRRTPPPPLPPSMPPSRSLAAAARALDAAAHSHLRSRSASAFELSSGVSHRLDIRSLHSSIKMNFDDDVEDFAGDEEPQAACDKPHYDLDDAFAEEPEEGGSQSGCAGVNHNECSATVGKNEQQQQQRDESTAAAAANTVSKQASSSSSSSSGCGVDNDYFMSQSSSSMSSSTTSSNERELFSQPASSSGIVGSGGNTSDEYAESRSPAKAAAAAAAVDSPQATEQQSKQDDSKNKVDSKAEQKPMLASKRRGHRIKTVGERTGACNVADCCCAHVTCAHQQAPALVCDCATLPPPLPVYPCTCCCDCFAATPPANSGSSSNSARIRFTRHDMYSSHTHSLNKTTELNEDADIYSRLPHPKRLEPAPRKSSTLQRPLRATSNGRLVGASSVCDLLPTAAATAANKENATKHSNKGGWLERRKYSRILPKFLFASSATTFVDAKNTNTNAAAAVDIEQIKHARKSAKSMTLQATPNKLARAAT